MRKRKRKRRYRPSRKSDGACCSNCESNGSCCSGPEYDEQVVEKAMSTGNSSAILKQQGQGKTKEKDPKFPALPNGYREVKPRGTNPKYPLIIGPGGDLRYRDLKPVLDNKGRPVQLGPTRMKEFEDFNPKPVPNVPQLDADKDDPPAGKLWVQPPGGGKPELMDQKDYIKIPKNKGYEPYQRPKPPAQPQGAMPAPPGAPAPAAPAPGKPMPGPPVNPNPFADYDRNQAAELNNLRRAPKSQKDIYSSSSSDKKAATASDVGNAASVLAGFASGLGSAAAGAMLAPKTGQDLQGYWGKGTRTQPHRYPRFSYRKGEVE